MLEFVDQLEALLAKESGSIFTFSYSGRPPFAFLEYRNSDIDLYCVRLFDHDAPVAKFGASFSAPDKNTFIAGEGLIDGDFILLLYKDVPFVLKPQGDPKYTGKYEIVYGPSLVYCVSRPFWDYIIKAYRSFRGSELPQKTFGSVAFAFREYVVQEAGSLFLVMPDIIAKLTLPERQIVFPNSSQIEFLYKDNVVIQHQLIGDQYKVLIEIKPKTYRLFPLKKDLALSLLKD